MNIYIETNLVKKLIKKNKIVIKNYSSVNLKSNSIFSIIDYNYF